MTHLLLSSFVTKEKATSRRVIFDLKDAIVSKNSFVTTQKPKKSFCNFFLYAEDLQRWNFWVLESISNYPQLLL